MFNQSQPLRINNVKVRYTTSSNLQNWSDNFNFRRHGNGAGILFAHIRDVKIKLLLMVMVTKDISLPYRNWSFILLGVSPIKNIQHYILIIFSLFCLNNEIFSQACYPNFDFENGTFDNWDCATGSVDSLGAIQLFSNNRPQYNRHTLIKTSADAALDPYGKFSTNSPNGSNYCMKLGNNEVGAEAEQISYTFTVPPDREDYAIIFNYAVVFENPNHELFQQPRFTSKIYDVTADKYIECGSFDFAASSSLPGFKLSDSARRAGIEVYYKPWSSATIKLQKLQNHQIRLEFTTNDCTRRGHFGYAYIDVVNNCNASQVMGNVACVNTTSLTLAAPLGFQDYKWYNQDFSVLLGTGSKLFLEPPPPPGVKYAVILIPYAGVGCIDTAYTNVIGARDTLKFSANDSLTACLPEGIPLAGAITSTQNSPGLTYSYYTDKTLEEGVASYVRLKESGTYYIKALNKSGCEKVDSIKVIIYPQPVIVVKDFAGVQAPQTVNITASVFDPSLKFSFWLDEKATKLIPEPTEIRNGGIYYIKAVDVHSCVTVKSTLVKISSRPAMPNAFTPNGDGKNDVFKFVALGGVSKLYYFRIYNRNGQLVFSSVKYGDGWDGTINGKPQDPGGFVWMAKGEDWNGNVFEESGTMILVR